MIKKKVFLPAKVIPMKQVIRGQSEKGMSLVEVLVALVILTLGTGLLLSIFSGGMRWNREAALKTRDLGLACQVIEILKSHPEKVKENRDGDMTSLNLNLDMPAGLAFWTTITVFDESLDLYLVRVEVSGSDRNVGRKTCLVTILPGDG